MAQFLKTLCLILLLIHVFCFDFCSNYAPIRKPKPTAIPTEDPRINDHNKPSEIKMLKYNNPVVFFKSDGHTPVIKASEYVKIRKMFGIEPHLMTSGKRRKRSIVSAGHYFFYNRALPKECRGNAVENCTESTVEKRMPPNGHPIRKSRRTFDVPQIGIISEAYLSNFLSIRLFIRSSVVFSYKFDLKLKEKTLDTHLG
ncbi:hypothetical protein JTE90_014593 [Oedothorax gibbosus]|uniref:Uncharacterized protein n=1 Tax=Oedothorax gibbosus TaxID=931172 RepID=A0AAV6V7Z6_9ARAC|nr:hypothetical protein JTE90_014593 [Oedothorax gibbosus]